MANTKKMDLVILGLLSHEPLTGYDIKKRLDTSLRFFWGGSFGSIYPTLAVLEKAGKVIKCSISDTGREKIQYSITEKGGEALKEWLLNPVEKDEIRYETLLKLFLGKEAGLEVSKFHIENFEERCKGELQILEWMAQSLQEYLEDETHKHYYITVLFGIKTYKAYLQWCEEAKELLKGWS